MLGAAMSILPTFADDAPEALYLVGSVNDWTLPGSESFDAARFSATPDAANPGHYTFVYERQQGEMYPVYFIFKLFSSKANSWEDSSVVYGSSKYQEGPLFSDAPATFTIDSDAHSIELTEQGTSNISFCNYYGGKVTIDVDWTAKTLSIAAEGQPVSNPEALYLVGDLTDWNSTIKLDYNSTKSVYEGTFENVAANKGTFKIFTTPTVNWNDNSLYVGAMYGPVTLFAPETEIKEAILGNASCDNCGMANFGGGNFTVEVDWQNWNYSFYPSEGSIPEKPESAEVIYLVGSPQNWTITSNAMPLQKIGDDTYYGNFNIDAGDLIFRFYTELGEWGENGSLPSIGSGPYDGQSVSVEFSNGVYNGPCVYGKGNWSIPGWSGGDLEITVDLGSMTVKFDDGTGTGIKVVSTENSMVVRNNILSTADNASITLYTVAGKRIASANGSLALSDLPKGIYVAVSAGKTLKVVK